ncbi:type 1 glutamine amidotransferase domain-containing protein [Winogradskyella flava]|uniref:type 1 glutamine amidotransferase domain-containing protein n=1 Tax=Winogradskyella flava TaxID=1884876 RepID=UPI0024929D3E|nr:type 1 glutamine amidotransferase domain-containing protein [Winogradskyella flava]
MRILSLFLSIILLNSCSNSEKEGAKINSKILFVVSNQHFYGDTDMNAANHFGEIVFAYDVLSKEHYEVDFVSPKGGAIPIGYLSTSDSIQKTYLYNFDFMSKLKNTLKPEAVDASNYKAVYYVGGGAAMFGVPENENIQDITMSIYDNKGIVSAVCHGTAGIINLKTKDGKYLYQDKQVNGFPDIFENKEAHYYKTFPFSIEETIKERGGNFSYSKDGWDNYFRVDGRLITGQDPTAAASVAKKIIETLNQL